MRCCIGRRLELVVPCRILVLRRHLLRVALGAPHRTIMLLRHLVRVVMGVRRHLLCIVFFVLMLNRH